MSEDKITYFFNQFRMIRKEKKITISDISKNTKIQEKYIDSIENGEFDTLPKVYIRLFLKSYSIALGLNPDKIIIDYEDYISGNIHNVKNSRTPKFIENKTHLNDNNNDQTNLLNNAYLFDSKKIIAILFLVVFVVSSWVILSVISKNRYNEHQIQFSNKKLSWEFFESLELLDTEKIKINKINSENIIGYNAILKENKILISQIENNLFIINRILNVNDQDENITSNNIKFGIFSGHIDFNINGQKINFTNQEAKIIGYLYPNKKELIIEYYK